MILSDIRERFKLTRFLSNSIHMNSQSGITTETKNIFLIMVRKFQEADPISNLIFLQTGNRCLKDSVSSISITT